MGWIQADGGYEVALEDGAVVCRNSAGKRLRQVPAKLRDDAAVTRLRQLAEWLERHERECRMTVERWILRSLAVPAKVLAASWPDDVWRTALTDLVVAPLGSDGRPRIEDAGFLRDIDAECVLGLVNLDGETVRVRAAGVALPHPVLLEDLDDLREFSVDLGVEQAVPQLFREVFAIPGDRDAKATAVQEFSGGRYGELRQLLARVGSLGYRTTGGYAVCPVFEDGRLVEAASWVGSDYPLAETETGPLAWWDADGKVLPLGAVGPVAWSEGMRMAAALYAGRTSDEAEAAA